MMVASNENVYMTQELFREWACKFVLYSKPSEEFPVLLLMDNFIGHLDNAAFEYFFSNSVFVIGLPQNTSDITQPLDLSVFGPYKKKYRQLFSELQ